MNLTLKDLDLALPHYVPPPKPLVVDERGRVIPHDSRHPDLDWIADIQLAPNARGYVSLICACALMYRALKEVQNDPARKKFRDTTKEAIDEALSCAE